MIIYQLESWKYEAFKYPCFRATVVGFVPGFEQAILTVAAHEARPRDVEELMEVPLMRSIYGIDHIITCKIL
jgi:hypothetical protein